MMIPRSRLALMVVLFSTLFFGQPQARGISLDEAVERARERVGGRVISAETQERNGHQVHNIRLLTKDGKVKRIRIDSGSGKRMRERSRR